MAAIYDSDKEPNAETIQANFTAVQRRMQQAYEEYIASFPSSQATLPRRPRLIAASKTKSPECLRRLYDCGHLVLGENYVHEMVQKSAILPDDVEWHLIGHLQSNKIKELFTGVPKLSMVHSVDSEGLASKLNAGCEKYRDGAAIDVLIQVNTSGEESKFGTTPGDQTEQLARFIQQSCPLLRLRGLMTIGMLDYSSKPENFTCLTQCRADVARVLGLEDETTLELSMGMSGDFEAAIKMGSTMVRVGTALFGERYYPPAVPK